MLRALCSEGLLSVDAAEDPEHPGVLWLTFKSHEIGLSYVSAQEIRAPSPKPDSDGRRLKISEVQISKPTKTQFLDMFVHEDIVANPAPELEVVSESMRWHRDPESSRLSERLPATEQASVVRHGFSAADSPDVPRSADVLEHAFTKMSWTEPERFQLVRCRVGYPMMGALIRLSVPVSG
ncbi:MAG: hypothetical protein DHS20C14_02590 [Phycisphaeraceae bacterium]|nr:MAG: hypothetical protein DHS20C14_02590 [Phycisphaeraceae bacterium]